MILPLRRGRVKSSLAFESSAVESLEVNSVVVVPGVEDLAVPSSLEICSVAVDSVDVDSEANSLVVSAAFGDASI